MNWFWNRPKPRPLADPPNLANMTIGQFLQRLDRIEQAQGALLAAINEAEETERLRNIAHYGQVIKFCEVLERIEKRLDGIEPQFGNVLGSLTALMAELDLRLDALDARVAGNHKTIAGGVAENWIKMNQVEKEIGATLCSINTVARRLPPAPPKQQGGKRSKKGGRK
jgi:hypothetical protein